MEIRKEKEIVVYDEADIVDEYGRSILYPWQKKILNEQLHNKEKEITPADDDNWWIVDWPVRNSDTGKAVEEFEKAGYSIGPDVEYETIHTSSGPIRVPKKYRCLYPLEDPNFTKTTVGDIKH